MQNKFVRFWDIGLKPYQETLEIQERLFKKIIDSKIANRKRKESDKKPTSNYLLFCEHPHVYTLGKSGQARNLLLRQEELAQQRIEYYPTGRGGDITYHGPGQLVVYPILDLENFFTDIHKYLRLLEEAVILTLTELGIESRRIDKLTGVWIDHIAQPPPQKICALGVRTSRWVSMHGLALNVNTDLDYFKNIIPCGITDKGVTSVQRELAKKVDMRLVKTKMKCHLTTLFSMDVEELK